jgi:molybdopterin-binding protein
MKPPPSTARNRYMARVRAIVEAPVLSEIEVELPGGLVLDATISTRDIEELNLRVGGAVVASMKADDVSLALL